MREYYLMRAAVTISNRRFPLPGMAGTPYGAFDDKEGTPAGTGVIRSAPAAASH